MRNADVDDCIAAGARHLAAHRSTDGLWRDFQTLAGLGADWVTAFICYAVRDCLALRHEVDHALQALLVRQRRPGGWAYNEVVPADCDSTSWALLALSARPLALPSVGSRARRYLLAHRDPSTGGFATYNQADGIGRFIGVDDPAIIRGWLAPHPCVTGVAVQALLAQGEGLVDPILDGTLHYLRESRNADGLWTSYWWSGTAYGTYVALRALLWAGAISVRDAMTTLRTVADDQGTIGLGVFPTSLRVLTLLLVPDSSLFIAAKAAVQWMMSSQRADGGWPSAPILRIPPPPVVDPENYSRWDGNAARGSGVILADHNGLFTTAAALWALTTFQAASFDEE